MHPDTLLSSKVSLDTLRIEIIFFERFAQLLASDVPLLRAIDIAAEELIDTKLQDVIRTIKVLLEKGESISDAFRRYPSHFSKFAMAVIDSGEREGRLDENLFKLAESLRREVQNRQETQLHSSALPSASSPTLVQENIIAETAKQFAETLIDAIEQVLAKKVQRKRTVTRTPQKNRLRNRNKAIQHRHPQQKSARRRQGKN